MLLQHDMSRKVMWHSPYRPSASYGIDVGRLPHRLHSKVRVSFFSSRSSDLRTKYAEPLQRGHAILVI